MSWDIALQRRRAISPFQQMFKVSRLDPTVGFFWCLVVIHVLVWTILASLTQPNLPAETLEMLASGRTFAWGYASQPPLGVWLAATVNRIASPSNWPVYMLAQICGVVSVWSAWKLARQFLHPWTALCAAFVLLGGFSCTIAASAFSGDLLAGAFWSLSIYVFHLALTRDRRRYWAATGLCLALGFLSSYGTFLLLLTMFIFTLVDDRARRCWDSSWPFLAGMAMVAFLMPHLTWLAQNQFLTVQAGIERSASVAHHLMQPLSFLGTQLLCVIPVVILLTPLVAWFSFEEPAKNEDDDREFARRYLLWMTCLPPAIIFGLSLMAGPSSGLFAGVTNWSYLGVVFLMWGHLSETRLSWRRSIIRIGGAVGLFAAALIALNIMLPQIQRQGVSTQFPGSQLTQQIEQIWSSAGYGGRAPIVGGPADLVHNATWYSNKSRPMKSYADLNPAKSAGINDQTLIREGGVIVWNANEQTAPTEAELRARFGQISVVNPVDLKWQNDASLPAVRVGMAVVHPASSQIIEQSQNGFAPGIGASSPFVTSDGRVIQPNVPTTPTQPNAGPVNPGSTLPSHYPAATYPGTYPGTGSTTTPTFTQPPNYQPASTYEPTPANRPTPAYEMKNLDLGASAPFQPPRMQNSPASTTPGSNNTSLQPTPAAKYDSGFPALNPLPATSGAATPSPTPAESKPFNRSGFTEQ